MPQPFRTSLIAALAALALCACGGGGGGSGDGSGGTGGDNPPGGTPGLVSLDLQADLVNTGFATSAAQFQGGGTLQVGDDPTNASFRGLVRFPIGQIPAGATVTVASLRCSQTGVTQAPYAALGVIVVDRVDLGPALDGADHGSVALTPNVGQLSGDATLAVKVVDVTAAVVADLAAARATSDFRLAFTTPTDGDNQPDRATFSAIQPGEELVLRVTYSQP